MRRIVLSVLLLACAVSGAAAFVKEDSSGMKDPSIPAGEAPAQARRGPVLPGWSRSVSGDTISYHSPLPQAGHARLCRATDGKSRMAWETKPLERGTARVVWLAGLGCNLGEQSFELSVEGRPVLTFASADQPAWEVTGEGGFVLAFHSDWADRYRDRFGLMSLTVPEHVVKPGKSLTLEIRGEEAGSSAWVMTFEYDLSERARLSPEPAILRGTASSGPRQPVALALIHLGPPAAYSLRAPGMDPIDAEFREGIHHRKLLFRPVDREQRVTLAIAAGEMRMERPVTLSPVRPWIVHLVQHTHTDIGYTLPQSEILPRHLRYIDRALDLCDRTDSLPDDARFRWTCETSWAASEYLRARPSRQIERLRRRVEEGRIEVTALPLNLSELADENLVHLGLRGAADLRAAGLKQVTAMQNDVHGLAWSLVDLLSAQGVRFASMGENAHRALAPFERPTLFWWESPAGNRLLTFRADHYMTGNFWGLPQGTIEEVRSPLLAYLAKLEQAGYSDRRITVQYSGSGTDNSPPSAASSHFIARWNEMYEWPRLRSSVAREFFEGVLDDHDGLPGRGPDRRRGTAEGSVEGPGLRAEGAGPRAEGAGPRAGLPERPAGNQGLPVYRAAWPDWWTDGFGSAARETGRARTLEGDLIGVQALLSALCLRGAAIPGSFAQHLSAVQEGLLFYTEHTMTAAESISQPLAENTQVQWASKASFLWQAGLQLAVLRDEAWGFFEDGAGDALPAGPGDALPFEQAPSLELTCLNPLSEMHSGPLAFLIDRGLAAPGDPIRVVDESGRAAPLQLLDRRPEGERWILWASDVPPLGIRRYRVLLGREKVEGGPASEVDRPEEVRTGHDFLENRSYRIEVDSVSGSIRRILDKELGRELLDPDPAWPAGAPIYERLSDRHPMELYEIGEHTRKTWSSIRLRPGAAGPIWSSLIVTGSCDGFTGPDGVICEIRLHHTEKRIELVYTMRKSLVREPESAYLPFPFRLSGGALVFEGQGGIIRPGRNQLRGTANDWNTVQSFAAVRSPEAQIVFAPIEAPLVQFGGINTGRYQRDALPETTAIYSWVFNNYWTTNFLAGQEGDLRFSYALTSGPDTTDAFATRFAWSARVPLLANLGRPVPAPEEIWLPVDFGSAHLVAASPEFRTGAAGGEASEVMEAGTIRRSDPGLPRNDPGRGLILLVREVEGKDTVVRPLDPSRGACSRFDPSGRMVPADGTIRLRPWESMVVRYGEPR